MMLEFNESTENAKKLAIHYAELVGDSNLISFMSSATDITSADEARNIIEGFRKMTNLAVEDHYNNVTIEDIADI